jgi:hypothetical protein
MTATQFGSFNGTLRHGSGDYLVVRKGMIVDRIPPTDPRFRDLQASFVDEANEITQTDFSPDESSFPKESLPLPEMDTSYLHRDSDERLRPGVDFEDSNQVMPAPNFQPVSQPNTWRETWDRGVPSTAEAVEFEAGSPQAAMLQALQSHEAGGQPHPTKRVAKEPRRVSNYTGNTTGRQTDYERRATSPLDAYEPGTPQSGMLLALNSAENGGRSDSKRSATSNSRLTTNHRNSPTALPRELIEAVQIYSGR